MSKWVYILFLLFCFPCCGYRSEGSALSSRYQTISVPYFKGDDQGRLTEAVIKALSLSSSFEYVRAGGALTLEGTMTSDVTEHIGYQYDRDPLSAQRQNRLIPNEGSRAVSVTVSLVDTQSQQVVYGPFNFKGRSDFDFIDADSLKSASFIDSAGKRQSVLFFSLGQLDSFEGARDISLDLLYPRLALKIVESIRYSPNWELKEDKLPDLSLKRVESVQSQTL